MIAVACALAVMAAAFALSGAVVDAAQWPLRIATVARPAEIRPKGGQDWTPASLRALVGPGTAARTFATGRLTFLTPGGQALRLAPASRLQIGDAVGPDRPVRASLESGWLWVAVLPGTPVAESVEIDAGSSTIAVRDGGASIMRNDDGSVMLRAYHGGATATGTGPEGRWTRALAGGQEVFVAATGAAGKVAPITTGKPEADWVRVNEDQDRAGGYGARSPAK